MFAVPVLLSGPPSAAAAAPSLQVKPAVAARLDADCLLTLGVLRSYGTHAAVSDRESCQDQQSPNHVTLVTPPDKCDKTCLPTVW